MEKEIFEVLEELDIEKLEKNVVFEIGYKKGKENGYDAGYEDGYEKGKEVGYEEGYGSGYEEGKEDGYREGYREGKEVGYEEGYEAGIENSDTYDEGYNSGYELGKKEGFKLGLKSAFSNQIEELELEGSDKILLAEYEKFKIQIFKKLESLSRKDYINNLEFDDLFNILIEILRTIKSKYSGLISYDLLIKDPAIFLNLYSQISSIINRNFSVNIESKLIDHLSTRYSLNPSYMKNIINIETDLYKIIKVICKENKSFCFRNYILSENIFKFIYRNETSISKIDYEKFFKFLFSKSVELINTKFEIISRLRKLENKLRINFLGAGGVNSNLIYLWVLSWKYFHEIFYFDGIQIWDLVTLRIYDPDKFQLSNIFRIIPSINIGARKPCEITNVIKRAYYKANCFYKNAFIKHDVKDLDPTSNICVGLVSTNERKEIYNGLAERKINFLEVTSLNNYVYFRENPLIDEDLFLANETYGQLDPFSFMSDFFFNWKELDKFILRVLENGYVERNKREKLRNTKRSIIMLDNILQKINQGGVI
ncbi:MAG: hypothetical protein KatS3mg068_1548 [Candidatus Sericytochromatia bacterium]|nr:MAG: hypothetical protein KatS3mg068_1548 [Candidatus Sericytochromatia bacterium]